MATPRGFYCAVTLLLATSAIHAEETGGELYWSYHTGKFHRVGEELPWGSSERDQRRDPFTFRREFPVPASIARPDKSNSVPLIPRKVDRIPEVVRLLADAESSLADVRGTDSIAACDAALAILKKEAEGERVRELRESAQRIRIAGQRMAARHAAQSEFDRLNIRLSGVIAKERQPQAIVNTTHTRIVGKGDLIALDENQEAMVEEILPGQVIVLYKGYRMSLSMADAK